MSSSPRPCTAPRARSSSTTPGTSTASPSGIKLVGRVEDERRDIADLVRAELEQAGFNVAITYDQFGPAVQKVYSTDPQSFEWHIYTEGWGRGSPERYDVGGVNSFIAPWLGNMPGWLEEGFWQYENDELDELGTDALPGRVRQPRGAQRDLPDHDRRPGSTSPSVSGWPPSTTASRRVSELEGVTPDLVAGPRNVVDAARGLRARLATTSASATSGSGPSAPPTTPSVASATSTRSTSARNLIDPAIQNDPFTGIPQPFRARYEVETAGPDGDARGPRRRRALGRRGQGLGAGRRPGPTAVSKVTFDYSGYTDSNWHHGQPITMADAVYSIAQTFDLAYDPEKARIETALAVTARPILETFKGYRLTEDDQLEVYVDYWHFDEDHIGQYANPVSFDMPWELKAAMDDLVFEQRRAAYSNTAASRFSVPWLSLVLRARCRPRRPHAATAGARRGRAGRASPTSAARPWSTPEEAVARYEAAQDWFDDKEHLVISQGPFYLEQFDPPAQFAELHRLPRPELPLQARRPLPRRAPDAGHRRHRRRSLVVPGEDAVVTATRQRARARSGCSYLLLDPAIGEVVDAGRGRRMPATARSR